ncbi:hypothetical protein DPMN_154738 [Dreissena polymorpha]|uniref:Uncharacterized protein n=1 Tax=Dreissena polymorpha TaxID=45954 RepID=A0A9D4JA81_DREPO|nr:hypothetical protein DPMN_154738 [Dreissena polymorpha]
MVTVDVCIRKRFCICLVVAGLVPLRDQYEIDLDVYLLVWRIPGRCSRRFVRVQRVGQCEVF